MDEIKRALETAEYLRFQNLVIHLGEKDDGWSPRAIEYALTALEHLGAFARPLGVQLLLENLTNEPTTPEHLATIIEMGHLSGVGICLDLGHAHLAPGIPQAIATLNRRIAAVHAHDNFGQKDEHLWPGDGAIDWLAAARDLQALEAPPAMVLEISSSLALPLNLLPDRIQKAFDLLA
jgi:sugar phosphate isomerase/epimerase